MFQPESAATQVKTPPKQQAIQQLLHVAVYIGFVSWLALKQLAFMRMIGIHPDRRLIVAVLAPILAVASPALWFRGRAQIAALLGADIITTLIGYANVVYFRQFRDLVSVASLRFASQLGEVRGSVFELLRPVDLLFVLDILLLGVCLLALGGLLSRLRIPRRGWVALAGTVLGVAAAGRLIVTDPARWDIWAGHTAVAKRVGVLNYQALDIWQYTARMAKRLNPAPEVVAKVASWFDENAVDPQATSPLYGAAKGNNVIYLQVESLHNFVINLKVNGQEITPNMNRLLGESIHFPNFYAQTGQGSTADAEFLANCSMYPAPTGAVYVEYAGNQFACLPGLLRENGYATVSMHSDRPDFWNRATVYPRLGIDRYYNDSDYVQDDLTVMGLSDASFLRQSVDKLQALPQPFQAMVITLSSHAPYQGNGIAHELDLGRFEGTRTGDYLQTIHYVDKAIGAFVDELKARKVLDDTVLLLYGDHTILRRDAEGLGELLGIAPTDEVSWTKVENKVPFLLRLPDGRQEVREDPAGEIDIAPTVAGLLGISTKNTFFMGRDLFAKQEGTVVLHNGTTVTPGQIFLPQANNWAGGCFDRVTTAALPLEACADVPKRAREMLAVSTHILDLNLRPSGG